VELVALRRPVVAALALSVTAALGAVVVPAPAEAAAHRAAVCATRWGSQPQFADGRSTAPVSGVRAGRHACFDRLVVDVDGPLGPWTVRYVDRVFRDGRPGEEVPLRGGARLEVAVHQPPLATDAWFREDGSLLDTRGYRTFRELAWAGEPGGGRTLLGLGVRARLPVRAFVLPGPGTGSRLVVDVAHRW